MQVVIVCLNRSNIEKAGLHSCAHLFGLIKKQKIEILTNPTQTDQVALVMKNTVETSYGLNKTAALM